MQEFQRRKNDSEKAKGGVKQPWPTVARNFEKRTQLMEDAKRGVAVFNAEANLIQCNSIYADLFELEQKHLRPGTSLEDILHHQVDLGNIPDNDPETYVASHVNAANKQKVTTRLEIMPSGAVLSSTNIPVDGGGWITMVDDLSDIYTIKDELEHSSFYDRRTRLPNKQMLLRAMDDSFAHQWAEESFAVIAIDFTAFNGPIGNQDHHQMHAQIADRLRNTVRATDVPAKLDGARFVILENEVSCVADVEALVNRLSSVLAKPYTVNDQTLIPSFNLGIAMANNKDIGEQALLQQALNAAERARDVLRTRSAFHIDEPQALSA